MTAALIVGVIALGVAVVARVTWRRAADERQSVRHHQHTLDTLRHMADRRQQLPSGPPPPGSAPRSGAVPSPRRRPPPGPGPAPGGRRPPSPQWAVDRGARRRGAVAIGVAVVVVVGAVGLVATLVPSGPHRALGRGTHPATAGVGARATTVAPDPGTPVTATAHGATYVATRARYTVVLDATAPCWVLATDTDTGAVVWTGTVPAGASQSLPASGTLAVELGAPSSVSATVDGTTVRFPMGYGAPFTLTFETGVVGAR